MTFGNRFLQDPSHSFDYIDLMLKVIKVKEKSDVNKCKFSRLCTNRLRGRQKDHAVGAWKANCGVPHHHHIWLDDTKSGETLWVPLSGSKQWGEVRSMAEIMTQSRFAFPMADAPSLSDEEEEEQDEKIKEKEEEDQEEEMEPSHADPSPANLQTLDPQATPAIPDADTSAIDASAKATHEQDAQPLEHEESDFDDALGQQAIAMDLLRPKLLTNLRSIFFGAVRTSRSSAELQVHIDEQQRLRAEESEFCAAIKSMLDNGWCYHSLRNMLNDDPHATPQYKETYQNWVQAAILQSGHAPALLGRARLPMPANGNIDQPHFWPNLDLSGAEEAEDQKGEGEGEEEAQSEEEGEEEQEEEEEAEEVDRNGCHIKKEPQSEEEGEGLTAVKEEEEEDVDRIPVTLQTFDCEGVNGCHIKHSLRSSKLPEVTYELPSFLQNLDCSQGLRFVQCAFTHHIQGCLWSQCGSHEMIPDPRLEGESQSKVRLFRFNLLGPLPQQTPEVTYELPRLRNVQFPLFAALGIPLPQQTYYMYRQEGSRVTCVSGYADMTEAEQKICAEPTKIALICLAMLNMWAIDAIDWLWFTEHAKTLISKVIAQQGLHAYWEVNDQQAFEAYWEQLDESWHKSLESGSVFCEEVAQRQQDS